MIDLGPVSLGVSAGPEFGYAMSRQLKINSTKISKTLLPIISEVDMGITAGAAIAIPIVDEYQLYFSPKYYCNRLFFF